MNFQSAWIRVLEWWPFVRKSTMYALVEKECAELIERQSRNLDMQHKEHEKNYRERERVLNVRHAEELEKRSAVADSIIDKLSRIEFRRGEHKMYRILLEFDARITDCGAMLGEQISYIASRVGRRVEREIATARFVQKAHEAEYPRTPSRHENFIPSYDGRSFTLEKPQ